MPAYSFKEQFVPMVMDGSKPGTIRSFRKYAPRVGQLAHLFFGMRTKFCKKLRTPSPPIREVVCVLITVNGSLYVIDTNWLDEDARERVKGLDFRTFRFWAAVPAFKDALAWQDGFRHADDPMRKTGCFDMMIKFWEQTHELPFVGNYILWGESDVMLKGASKQWSHAD
jgi:hypothetical protein